jgi:hypothetical protein
VKGLVRRSVGAVLSAIFGVAGGLAVSFMRPSGERVVRKNESVAEPDPGRVRLAMAPRAGDPAYPAGAIDDPAIVVAPRGRVAVVQAAPPPEKPPLPPVTRMDADPPELGDLTEEADRLHEEHHEAALRRHRDEPKDPRWASATEAILEGEIGQIGDPAKFKLVKLDCRTISCVGVLEWPSYGEAQRSYGVALRRPYSVNCGLEVLLPPPLNPAAPYQASMIFDCESWRAEGN